MSKPSLLIACILVASLVRPGIAQTTINGASLALRSNGSAIGGDWVLNQNGYVGTYVTLAQPGDLTVRVRASGTPGGSVNPQLGIAIADTKVQFDVVPGINDYFHTFALPAGTYFVRNEFNNQVAGANRQLRIANVTMEQGQVSNTSSTANALAASDTYIANFRRGDGRIQLVGVAPGTEVNLKLARHAFNFGTAVPGHNAQGVNQYLGNNGTAQQTNYQARLNENFNAIVPENAGKWSNNEAVRNVVTMQNIDSILDYAQDHNMRARMHNLIWGNQQPGWVNTMLNNPSQTAVLRQEVSERIDYYVGTGGSNDRALRYLELDVYNESYHTGSNAQGSNNYWDRFGGASGIAEIFHEVAQTVNSSGANLKLFTNEYGVLDDGNFANWYMRHIEEIREAGVAANYGDLVDGIGVQYYPSSAGLHVPSRVMAIMQNLSVQGAPISLTEFGAHTQVSPAVAATILDDMMRLIFGNANANGFFMWGFQKENTGSNLFAPNAALFEVNTNDWNTWTITEAGKRWQDRLGIQDWDGDTSNGWNTNVTLTVGPDGTVDLLGYYGDYDISIAGATFQFELQKDKPIYSVVVAPGDYNADGTVDAADFTVWRDSLGSMSNLRADGNGNGVIDIADLEIWQSTYGTVYGPGGIVPEPTGVALLITVGLALVIARKQGVGDLFR